MMDVPTRLLTEASRWPKGYVDRRGFAGPWCLVTGTWERLCAGGAAERHSRDGADWGTLSRDGQVFASVVIGPKALP